MAETEVVDAARRLVAASRALSGTSTQAGMLEAICDRDMAFHDLTVALGEPCDCEPGTCPSSPGEPEALLDGYVADGEGRAPYVPEELYETVQDQGGRL